MCDIGCFDFTGRGKKGNDQFFIHGCFIGLSVSACFFRLFFPPVFLKKQALKLSGRGHTVPQRLVPSSLGKTTPLPARSPIPIILNIFIRALFLGSEMPPLSICSLPVRIYSGFFLCVIDCVPEIFPEFFHILKSSGDQAAVTFFIYTQKDNSAVTVCHGRISVPQTVWKAIFCPFDFQSVVFPVLIKFSDIKFHWIYALPP